jgi:D-hexose-6-phosphate mutarotase
MPTSEDAAARLHAQWGLGTELQIRRGAGDLIYAHVDSPLANATLCLQGAQLIAWQPRGESLPVLWLPEAAQLQRGKAIRGGMPVCWPWFGPHPQGGGRPSHGFARTADWQIAGSRRLEAGDIELTLALEDSPATQALWPHAFRVELRVVLGVQLRAELSTTNTGGQAFALGEALHTYFRVSDIAEVQLQGLDGLDYVDNAAGARRGRQDEPLRFAGEFDRVYLNTQSDATLCDPGLRRRIRVTQFGARSTVVWNPWTDKAARLGDLGAGTRAQGGWREMLCVESGNALENMVTVEPGATHRMAALVCVTA